MNICLICGREFPKEDFCCGEDTVNIDVDSNVSTPISYSRGSSIDTLYEQDAEILSLIDKLSCLVPSENVDDKIKEIVEYYKESIADLEFETQMKNMEKLGAKSCQERQRLSNEIKRQIKICEKKLSELRQKQRLSKLQFKTQMFPSIKLDLSEGTKNLLDELNDTLGSGLKIGFDDKTTELLTAINSSFSGIKNNMSSFFETLNSSDLTSRIIDLIATLCMLKVMFSTELPLAIRGVLCTIFGVYMTAKYGLKKFRTQMDEGDFKPIVNGLVFLLHGILLYSLPGAKQKATKFVDFFSNFGKINENFEQGFTSVLLFIEKVVNSFRELVGSDELCLLSSKDEQLNDWIDTTNNFVTKYSNGDKTVDVDKAILVNTLKRQGYELEQKYGCQRNKTLLYGKFLYLFSAIKKISEVYEELDFADHSNRIMPVPAIFLSAPNCGKTFPVTIMAQMLLAKTLPIEQLPTFKKNPWTYMYAMQNSLGYHDGMNGSEKVFMNSEFLQARQVPGALMENMDFITDNDTAPKLAHMAEAHKKGKVRINHWFGIYCTNNMNFNDNKDDITDAFAVWRRFTRHIYFVGVNTNYCTEQSKEKKPWLRMIDSSKCPVEWTPEVQEYYRYDFHTGSHSLISFEQIIEDLISDHERNKNKHNAYLKTSESHINRIISERMRTQMDVENSNESRINHEELIRLVEDPGLKIRLLFNLNDYPMSLMPKFMNWLENRVRTKDDEEMQLLIFMKQFEVEVPGSTMDFIKECIANATECTKNLSIKVNMFFQEHSAVFDAIRNILMVISVFKATSSVVNYITSKPTTTKEFYFTENDSGTKGKGRRNNKQPKKNKTKKSGFHFSNHDDSGFDSFRTEGGCDVNSNDMMRNVFRRNLYELYMPGKDKRAGFILFIKNRVFLMPYHFSTTIQRQIDSGVYGMENVATLKKCGTKNLLSLPLVNLLKVCVPSSEGEDFCFGEATIDFPLHKDISSYFVPSKNYEKQFDKQGALLCPVDGQEFEKTNAEFKLVDDIGHGNDHDDFLNSVSIVYNIDTRVGDCGAPFFLRNAAMSDGRLMGIHVSGTDNGFGMSVAIYKEELMQACELVDSVKVTNVEYDFKNQGEFPDYFEGTYPIGRHESCVRNPTQSKIIPSVLTGIFGPPTTKPARLAREYDQEGNLSFDPFMVGLRKNLRMRPHVKEQVIKACEDHLLNTLINASTDCMDIDGKILTFDEAILGIPTLPYCDSIPRNTSAGYPYAMPGGLCAGNPGKTIFFGNGPVYDLTTPACEELRARNKERISNLEKGIRNETIYMDFAKDERRPIAKVDEGKTRMISACPLDHLIEGRQYFMSFAMWIQRNRIQNGICVGINPYSDEWDLLARRLKTKGSSVDAGDFSEFDYSELAPILWSILRIINRWYSLNGASDTENKVRETMWYEVVNSVHINGSFIYHLISSLPSGHFLTVIINSMYVQLAFRFAWIHLHNLDLNSLSHFNDHLEVQAYGDDNAHNKSYYASTIMNEQRLITIFKEIGLKYTNEKKDGDLRPSRALCDISFLKRSFRFEPYLNKYVAPLTLDTLLEFVYWTKKGSQEIEITKQNVDNCVMELSLHDAKTFDMYSSILLSQSFKLLRYTPIVTDRTQLLNATRHIEEIW
jgi:uncharacterized protein YjgD (DUF1641 family)